MTIIAIAIIIVCIIITIAAAESSRAFRFQPVGCVTLPDQSSSFRARARQIRSEFQFFIQVSRVGTCEGVSQR